MESLNKSVNKDSMLVTYLRGGAGSPIISPGGDRFSSNYQRNRSGSSRSPLSPLENVKAPMMAEDEVLVMDGVLVSSVVGSGSSSNSSSSSGKSVHKKALCRVWEDLGHCRYAANCQFAHGKEELHPTHFPIKNKAAVHTCNSYVTSPRSSPYVPKCRILHPAMTKAVVAANQTAFSKIPGYTSISPVTISSEKFSKNSTTPFSTPDHFLRTYISTRPEHCNKSSAANIKSDSRMVFTATISSDYWSPQDDGIEIALPHQTDKCISRAEVDAYIHSVLYGPATKKRLPVFSEFCPG
ncbi:hypothetical protein POPTR_005G176900v4 [Populus trichocarpa]|uniref:Uncharacterized protein n=1 Tax=Populus trichocarpa TaxID=3694 RepID=A0ACC0T0I5_POPTR|nr:zinc finger protein zfs1 [Populus trichocarpa]XP_024456817.2 zinc finger protein zfs1 [Populus trichocarpa]KAI9395036.1 hypothetical protein POPTR_005G176900v4 [Populus trichocarpa]